MIPARRAKYCGIGSPEHGGEDQAGEGSGEQAGFAEAAVVARNDDRVPGEEPEGEARKRDRPERRPTCSDDVSELREASLYGL